jgi:hypothetical protein
VILVVGPALNFLTLEGPGGSESFSGYEAEQGSTYVLAAVVIGLMGVLMFVIKSGAGRKVLGAIALLGALFAGFAGFVDLTDASDVPAELGDSISASAGLGTYVVLIGAVLALIGSLMALAAPDETVAGTPPGNRPLGTPPQAGPPPTTTPPPS